MSNFNWDKNLPSSRSPSPIKEKRSEEDKKNFGRIVTTPSGWSYRYIGSTFPPRSLKIPSSVGLKKKGPQTRSMIRKSESKKFPPVPKAPLFGKPQSGGKKTKKKSKK